MSEAPREPEQQPEPKGKGRRKSNGHATTQTGSQSVWSDRLIMGREGPKDCVANVAMALREDPAFLARIRFDEMRQCVVVGSVPWNDADEGREWCDRDDVALAEWMQLHGVVAKPATCGQAVQHVAEENRIHPLKDYLLGLKWDKVSRLSGWLTVYLGAEASDYSQAVARCYLISAVARALEPGCKVDHALIFEGDQGKIKSTALRVLAVREEWFTDEIADLGTKDAAQDLLGKWIIELSELSAMKRGDVERTKAFFSRSKDHYRPSYGRRSRDFPRGCVFAGSTNHGTYLSDETGNRRFWPVKAGKVDLEALRRDIDQLWAEAVTAFKAGEQWWLVPELEMKAAVEQERRVEVDPWAELILKAATAIHNGEPIKNEDDKGYIMPKARACTKVTTNAVLDELTVPKERRDRRQSTRIGIVLGKAGWAKRESRTDEPRHWYEPPVGVEE